MASLENIPLPPDSVRIKHWYLRHYYAVVKKGQNGEETQMFGNWTVQSWGNTDLVVVDNQDGMVIPWSEVACLRFPLEEKEILARLQG